MKKQKLANEDIREIIRQSGLRHFEVFDELKLSQASWSRLLCRTLNGDDRDLILETVDKLKEGRC